MTKTTNTAPDSSVAEKKASFKWTDERVALLREMWGTGCSAADIAAAIGDNVTRNAVIGKAHRLGLKSGAAAKTQAKIVTVLELSDRVCRWPIGDPKKTDFRFCGLSIERGMRYCAKHREFAFQNPNKKKEDEAFEGQEGQATDSAGQGAAAAQPEASKGADASSQATS